MLSVFSPVSLSLSRMAVTTHGKITASLSPVEILSLMIVSGWHMTQLLTPSFGMLPHTVGDATLFSFFPSPGFSPRIPLPTYYLRPHLSVSQYLVLMPSLGLLVLHDKEPQAVWLKQWKYMGLPWRSSGKDSVFPM